MVGCLIGIISGRIIEPSWGAYILIPAFIGFLDGVFLGRLYRKRTIHISFIALISLGIAIGMFLGSILGGVLGTILSIPFPESWIPHLFLIGTFLGMAIVSARIPIILVNMRDGLQKRP